MALVPFQSTLCIWEPGIPSNSEGSNCGKFPRSSGRIASARVPASLAETRGEWKMRSLWVSETFSVIFPSQLDTESFSTSSRNFAWGTAGRRIARDRRSGVAAGGGWRNSKEVFGDQNYGYERSTGVKVGPRVLEIGGVSDGQLGSEWQAQERVQRSRYEGLDRFNDGSRRGDGSLGAGGAAEVESRGSLWNDESSQKNSSEIGGRNFRGDFGEGTSSEFGGRNSRRDFGEGTSSEFGGRNSRGDFGESTSSEFGGRNSRGDFGEGADPGGKAVGLGRSSRRYPGTSLDVNGENSSPGAGTKVDYETETVRTRETTAGYWKGDSTGRQGAPFAGFVEGSGGRGQIRNEQVSLLSDVKESREMVLQVEKSGRNAFSRNHHRGEDGEVLERSLLYAKQVINQATARGLGVLTQLWVDLGSLKVVALEVRENLLFGNFDNVLLNRLRKVGDVILIHDDSAFLDDLDLFNCYDLVGSDVFTESGVHLGKVRDYDFRLEDGAVLSLEFDSFGFPIIPSNVVSTYSLTADEIVEAQVDGVLVRKGAEKRVRKLTKGIFSRPRQPPRGRQDAAQQGRKMLPQVSGASSSTFGAGSGYKGQIDALGEDNYTSTRYPAAEASYRSRAPGLEAQRKPGADRNLMGSPAQRRSEARQGQDPGAREGPSASSRFDTTSTERFEDSRSRPMDSKDTRGSDTPTIQPHKRPQNDGNRMSAPTAKVSGRGLPMSYRKPKDQAEESGP